jgi:hypothetical protein
MHKDLKMLHEWCGALGSRGTGAWFSVIDACVERRLTWRG